MGRLGPGLSHSSLLPLQGDRLPSCGEPDPRRWRWTIARTPTVERHHQAWMLRRASLACDVNAKLSMPAIQHRYLLTVDLAGGSPHQRTICKNPQVVVTRMLLQHLVGDALLVLFLHIHKTRARPVSGIERCARATNSGVSFIERPIAILAKPLPSELSRLQD